MSTEQPTTPQAPPSPPAPSPTAADALDRLASKLDEALDAVGAAQSYAKSTYQTTAFQLVEALMTRKGGLAVLYERASRFDEVGVFNGGPWVEAAKLQPPLVAGSLTASGVYPVVETMSELRVLAIAQGRVHNDHMTPDDARRFLEEVMALNLSFLFPGDTEAERIEGGPHRASNIALFELLARELGLGNLRREVVAEIESVCAQRPIQTERVRRMIAMAARIPDGEDRPDVTLERYHRAIIGPTPRSREATNLREYRAIVQQLDHDGLEAEAIAFGQSMQLTGLVSDHHAVLLRRIIQHAPELGPSALALTSMGAAALEHHLDEARRLISVAIRPSTAQSIYGLSKLIDRGLLQRQEIMHGLSRIVQLDFNPDVRRTLLARKTRRDGLTANAMLLAGVISMLGQPLGIGQGHNPTCQAARGLSLWAHHAPGHLLGLIVSAARHGYVEMVFEGHSIRSDLVEGGVAQRLDPDLDPVSLVLVPHLDRIYDEMMRRVALRGDDGHKWVNPALYGHYVPTGFTTVFSDISQTTVSGYHDFIRRLYATHHPAYNDGRRLMYPNPLGLLVTNSSGVYLGPHAISLQRVAVDTEGVLRAYFYNPNNEGRQDWGGGVRPSVRGNGEREGESSLPFHQLASRIYAYHYKPYEVGDGYAVPDTEVKAIEEAARASWGQAFLWHG